MLITAVYQSMWGNKFSHPLLVHIESRNNVEHRGNYSIMELRNRETSRVVFNWRSDWARCWLKELGVGGYGPGLQ